MAKLSYKERARQRREQEILRTAARMIRDHGYINLNMDELAEEVGISKPTLYQHFKGKDDMVVKTMTQSIHEMEAYLQTLDDKQAIIRIEKIMRYMLESHNDPEGFSVAILKDGSVALHHLKDSQSEMHESQLRVYQEILKLIKMAKAQGDIRADLPDMVVVSAMFSLLSVLQGPDIVHDYSVQPEAIIDEIVGFFRRGVAG